MRRGVSACASNPLVIPQRQHSVQQSVPSQCDRLAGPDQNLRKDSPRYIQNCSADMAKHSAIVSDNDLYDTTFDFDADLQTPGRISFTNAPFGSHNTWRNQRAALTLGYVQM